MNELEGEAERLRQAFASEAEILGDGRACPPAETLWTSAREESARPDAALILHMAECTSCAAAWRLARDLRSAESPAALAARSARGPRPRWRVPALAAAALAAVAVGIGIFVVREAGREPAFYRSQEVGWLRPTLPAGESLPRDHCLLRWTEGPEGTTYDIRVSTEDLDLLGRASRLERPEYLVPSDRLRELKPGSRIHWQVTAHLPDGRQSDSETFTTTID